MPTRLVLDELDVNLATFTAGGCLVVVVIIGSSADTRSLDTAVVNAIGVGWIIRARGVLCIGVGDVGHR